MIQIDTVACCIIGAAMGYFAYTHLADPEGSFEEMFGVPAEDPIQIHLIAVTGGFSACISIILFCLGLFQPSSNARKFALGAVAILKALNISTHHRFPVKGDDETSSLPLPILYGLLAVALLGATLSKTDARRREIVRAKQKAKSKAALYAKHAASKANNKGE